MSANQEGKEMAKKLAAVAAMTAMMFGSLIGTGHAATGTPGAIVGAGVLACNATIVFPHAKTDTPTSCNGTAGGAAVAATAGASIKVGLAVPDPTFVLTKSKSNFNASACYEETVDPVTGGVAIAASANGLFEAYGTGVKDGSTGDGYVRGSYEYTRVGVVAVVTLPIKKAGCGGTGKAADIRVGNDAGKGDPDSSDQIYCASNPAGAGLFLFVPLAVPVAGAPFAVRITGAYAILCAYRTLRDPGRFVPIAAFGCNVWLVPPKDGRNRSACRETALHSRKS